jgi:hypothetical protein
MNTSAYYVFIGREIFIADVFAQKVIVMVFDFRLVTQVLDLLHEGQEN